MDKFVAQDSLPWTLATLCLVGAVSFMRRPAIALLSFLIDKYLRWQKPIFSSDGQVSLPTCPYQWPNGQGDRAKFLDGIENSDSWGKQHGQVYSIWSGMNREVVLTHPQHLQAVFKDSDKHYKAENNNSGYLMSQLLGQCLGLISREQWRPLRSVAEIPFQHQRMSTYVDMVSRHVRQHFNELHGSGNLRLGRIHPAQDLKMLPFWIVAEMLYGQFDATMEAELQQLSHLREQLFKRMIQGGQVRWSWSRYLPTTANRMLHEFQSRWKSFNQIAYSRARRQDLSLPIVSLMNSAGAGTVELEQVLQTIDEALFANLDVTTGGISWNLVFLAAHPQAQDQVRSEALAAADSKSHILSSSSFVASCILESARLKPLAAFSVPQSAPTDRVVGGYVIPARTDFVVDAYALNIRNDFWGPDRQQYRPERFLEHRPTDLRYQYWRFGFGPRQCMGRYIADLVIRSLLVHLTTHYELGWLGKTASNTEWSRDLESWITLPDLELSCVPRQA